VLPIKQAEEKLADCNQRFAGEAAVDGDHTTDMTTTETINRQGSKGFKCSSISGPRHAETTLGKAVPPASEPSLALCHSKQEAEVHRVLLGQVHNRDGSYTESCAKLIPYIHDLAAREESGATNTTTEGEKVTKAITMDQTM